MSVTSSGRSSTSSTKRSISGLLVAIELASFFRIVVLPALGGETIRPRWPLPMGHMRSMMRAAVSCSSVSRRRRSSGNSGVSCSNTGPLPRHVGVDAVHSVDLEQRVVLLIVLGLADLAEHLIAAAQAEAADLAEAHVHVAVTLAEAVRAQEAEAVGQHVEDAGAGDRGAVVALLLAAAPAALALVAPAAVLSLALPRLLALLLATLLLRPFAVAGGPVGGRCLGRGAGGAGGRGVRGRSGKLRLHGRRLGGLVRRGSRRLGSGSGRDRRCLRCLLGSRRLRRLAGLRRFGGLGRGGRGLGPGGPRRLLGRLVPDGLLRDRRSDCGLHGGFARNGHVVCLFFSAHGLPGLLASSERRTTTPRWGDAVRVSGWCDWKTGP